MNWCIEHKLVLSFCYKALWVIIKATYFISNFFYILYTLHKKLAPYSWFCIDKFYYVLPVTSTALHVQQTKEGTKRPSNITLTWFSGFWCRTSGNIAICNVFFLFQPYPKISKTSIFWIFCTQKKSKSQKLMTH